MKSKVPLIIACIWLVLCMAGSGLLYMTHHPIYEMELEFVVLTTNTDRPYEQHQIDQAFLETYTSYLFSRSFLSQISDQAPSKVRKQLKIEKQPGNYLMSVRVKDADRKAVINFATCLSEQWIKDSDTIFQQQNVQLLTDIKTQAPERIDLYPWQRSCIWSLGMTFLFGAVYSLWKRWMS